MRRRKMARELQTDQLMKSLAMMEANHWSPEEGSFNDYSLYVYRQTAPEFTNRVKELEMKLKYPVSLFFFAYGLICVLTCTPSHRLQEYRDSTFVTKWPFLLFLNLSFY